jgi:hypothetical protein
MEFVVQQQKRGKYRNVAVTKPCLLALFKMSAFIFQNLQYRAKEIKFGDIILGHCIVPLSEELPSSRYP